MANNSLVTVYSWSIPLNNMLSVSLMRDTESKFKKFFCFLNTIPGIKGDNGNRTYEFKNGINFKLEAIKLYELYQVINACVKGQGGLVGKYSIINDSSKSSYGNGGGMKTLFVNYQAGSEDKPPYISLMASYNNTKCSVSMPAPTALAVAEVFKTIFEKYLKLDMEEFVASSSSKESNGNSHSNARPSEGSYANFSNDDAPF